MMLRLVLAVPAWWFNKAATFAALVYLTCLDDEDLGATWEWHIAA